MTRRPSFSGVRALVVGLGVSGFSTARALLELGARVRVTEAARDEVLEGRAEQLRALGAEVELGGHDLERLDADIAIVSPGIPPSAPVVRALQAGGADMVSEIEIAYRLADCDFIAVTGTNGKTTTTSLIAAILEEGGVPTIAAGNIGYPVLDAIASVSADGIVALEVSSFQLAATTSFRPRVGVLLNVAEDHTDWHGSFEEYAAAKARLVANQEPSDVFLPNLEDPTAMEIASKAPSRVVPFSAIRPPSGGIGVSDGRVVWHDETVFDVDDVTIPGLPGLEDAVAAAGATLEAGLDPRAVARAVHAFRPLRHRHELVAEADGIKFIDDSKATNPHATLAAARGMTDVVLIAGGRSKGIDLSPLLALEPNLAAVIAIGEARDELLGLFEGRLPTESAPSMHEAVRRAAAHATPGGSVLLSPACASLDMYRSYAERGEDFAREVRSLLRERAPRDDADGDRHRGGANGGS